jgi:hypothetical protein
MSASDSDERIALAQSFLQEAVYRSRALQSAAGALAPSDAPGRCGLGEKAAFVLDVTPEGAALFARIWPTEPPADTVERIRGRMNAWVVEQDALDRRRNHFLKAFRQKHGFDRTAYTPTVVAEFDEGLSRINATEDEARRAAGLELLEFA